jgi:hypothetical protein
MYFDFSRYVLGEEGYIWVGSYLNYSPRAWSFAPFHTESVQAALEVCILSTSAPISLSLSPSLSILIFVILEAYQKNTS